MISICKNTISHFKNLLRIQNKKHILIGVRGGGCNGLKYYIEPSSMEPLKCDEQLTIDKVPIVICGKSIMHLLGSELKWETNNMGSGITINNPNASATCGCGDTFSL